MGGDFSLWVYLAKTPLLWLTVTLTAYVLADRVAAADGRVDEFEEALVERLGRLLGFDDMAIAAARRSGQQGIGVA